MQNIFEQGAYDTLGNYGKIPSFEDHRLWWVLRFTTRRWHYCFHLKISIVPIILFAKVFIHTIKPKKQFRHNAQLARQAVLE